MSAQKSLDDYLALATVKKVTFLGPVQRGVREHTRWQCGAGHVFETSYFTLRKSPLNGCKLCSGKARKGDADYQELARLKRFTWLGPRPRHVRAHTNWRCSDGHTFSASFNSLYRSDGSGCAMCSRKAQHLPHDYHNLAAKKGVSWLGPIVTSALSKTTWKCDRGHPAFHACYNSLARRSSGNGCRRCAGMEKKSRRDYLSLATRRGILWVDQNVPQNTQTRTRWKCKDCNKVWLATYGNVNFHASHCPNCADKVNGTTVSKQQRALAKLVDGKLNCTVAGYVVDVLIIYKGVPIAIEYDAWVWHANRSKQDRRRDSMLIRAGCRVVCIKSNSLLPSAAKLSEAFDTLIAGRRRIEMRLPDWAPRQAFLGRATGIDIRRRRARRDSLAIAPSGCVGELDGRTLHIQSNGQDIKNVKLTPAESRLLANGLRRGSRAVCLRFNPTAVRAAIGHQRASDSAVRTFMNRFKWRISFEYDFELLGLCYGATRGQYATTISIRHRPTSRRSRTIQTSYREWRAFAHARAFARSLCLTSQTAWHEWSRMGHRPLDIPSNPNRTYRDLGWNNWSDWLKKRRN